MICTHYCFNSLLSFLSEIHLGGLYSQGNVLKSFCQFYLYLYKFYVSHCLPVNPAYAEVTKIICMHHFQKATDTVTNLMPSDW